jgi:hypothetical protein
MRDIIDDPVIVNMERTGHPDGTEPEPLLCLLCEQECETIFMRKADREVLGCDLCVDELDPWEVCGE